MRKFFFDCGTRDATASTALLVLRLATGLMMLLGHGVAKLHDFQKLKESWLVPSMWPLSYLSKSMSLVATLGAEIGASALIVVGLATRPAAFVLGFSLVVAAFQFHALDPVFSRTGGPSKEMALLYLFACVTLIISGAGRWSFDTALCKEKTRRRR